MSISINSQKLTDDSYAFYLTASSSGYTIKLETPITLTAGINEIALLSMTVGLQCAKNCDYRGPFSPDKCRTGCGEISQR
ncbi:hypothetical protein BHE74_00012229 [Ensete ventricosum]|nr:hypothetical protein BHE74_00012229 [Ensete ventricosum]